MQKFSIPAELINRALNSPYLRGGGEMGQLIRSFDWSQTVLGLPATWPQSLLTTLSIILNSKFPMFLWWGPALIQFYNDAYRPSLGSYGKHPKALGQRGEDCWPETWPTIKPLIDQVMSGGEGTWSEDQLIPIYRNNKLENVYWTFGYSKVSDESGKPAGVLVICNETTEKVLMSRKLEEIIAKDQKLNARLKESNKQLSEANEALKTNISYLAESQEKLHATIAELEKSEYRFRESMLRAPVAMAIFRGPEFVIELANDKLLGYWGRSAEDVLDLPLSKALPEVKGQEMEELLETVLATGTPLVADEQSVMLIRNGNPQTLWMNFIYEPVRDLSGDITKVMVVFSDVTEQVNARNAIEQAEEKLRHAVASASLGTWYINAETGEFVPSPDLKALFNFYPNEEMAYGQAMGLITGGFQDKVVTAIEEAVFNEEPFNMEFPIIGFHDKKLRWLKATGKLYPAEGNKPKHFSGTIADITEQNASDLRKYELLKEQFKEQQKQEIFRATIKTQEEERKRIAESLHNGIGQLLYAVKLNLSQIDFNRHTIDLAELQKAKLATEELLNEAIRDSRRISHELTPRFLEDFGLEEAIRDVCKHFNEVMKIKCHFTGLYTPLDKYLELSVYRIIQELILNIIKHAKATETSIEVRQKPSNITIIIADNGIGFNLAQVKGNGIGLQGIFNKVKLLNGKYKIENTGGTKVTIVIPTDQGNFR